MASSPVHLTVTELNQASPDEFVALVGPIVEHSPWVAAGIVEERPFADIDGLWAAMVRRIRSAPRDVQVSLIKVHPELAGAEALDGRMTDSSTSEQGRLGLTSLSSEDFGHLSALNSTYRERFGFPCIIALRMHQDQTSVFRAFEQRLGNDLEREIGNCIDQIAQIMRGRLYVMLRPSGWLSTHVLDISAGLPAAGMRIELFSEDQGASRLLASVEANGDGRTSEPLLSGSTMLPGLYRLQFHVADYCKARSGEGGGTSFLEIVPVVFRISDPNLHLHVPLLFTPWTYSTYRGS